MVSSSVRITEVIGNQQLDSIPALPNSLSFLSCNTTHITTLPSLPNGLSLWCSYNNALTSLPEFPDSLTSCGIYNNFNLHCLPELKRIGYLQFDSVRVGCVQNYGNVTHSIPALNSFPLCDLFNSYGCTAAWNIKGQIYRDSVINCSYDAVEDPLKSLKIQLYENGSLQQQTYSNMGGTYSFITDFSIYQYSIDTTSLPFTLACPDSGYYTSIITVLDSFDTEMNFGLRCKPGFDLVAQSIDGTFRLGDTRQLNIAAGDYSNFFDAHCIMGLSGSVQLVMSGAVTYVSPAIGALAPSYASGDTITWSIPDFGSINFFTDFNIILQTDTNAQIGSLVCFSLVVNPIVGDNNPSNNALDYCGVVVAGFDPNEKEVYPAGNIDTAQKWLTYTIHFQNTGTAEAQHIYVTDTLDTDVDPASFQLLAYSHQPMVQIKENAVRFNFPNINLPDSNTNEAASHGYVQYKVKLKDNLPVGTSISNTAFIYFDFNAPVVTNTTTNTIALISSIEDHGLQTADHGKIQLQPNPASSFVNVSVDESMLGSNLTVYDITGRKMTAVQLSVINNQLSIARFASGVYFVTVENERGRVTRKLVIQK